jgi:hypothetical protein
MRRARKVRDALLVLLALASAGEIALGSERSRAGMSEPEMNEQAMSEPGISKQAMSLPTMTGPGDARAAEMIGSANVPLDSWIYAALERLAALGYIESSFAGLKPWSRIECAEMTEEAGDLIEREGESAGGLNKNKDDARYDQALQFESRLRDEFAGEFELLDGGANRAGRLESVYLREVSLSGAVLTDGYHFGQTLGYDFGRPARRGANGQAGASFRAAAGPFAIYARAEFQHSPAAPPLSGAVRNFISAADLVPVPSPSPSASINRPRLLDAYVSLKLTGGWQFSFGKQSLEWAPGPGGSLLWSDNAEPIPMARLLQTATRLPSILKRMGPVRVDSFFGQLAGHRFVPHPYIYGNKIDFKPCRSLEFGFARTVTIGGKGGDPLTSENLLLSFLGRVRGSYNSVPGDSHASFDWTWQVPGVNRYLVFYGELYADDDPVPFVNPPKNPYRPGFYLTRFPGLAKLDFHMEAADTESPGQPDNVGNLNYWNYQYRDGYTNDGNLIGNTVGRMGRTVQCWFTYWMSPQHTLTFTYKHNSVSPDFVPQGGYWQDYAVRHEWQRASGVYLKTEAQFEHIASYPMLFHGARTNLTTVFELGLMPRQSH